MGGLLHLVQRGGAWAGSGPDQSPPRCTKCNSPPTNGHCTNFITFNVALSASVSSDLKALYKSVIIIIIITVIASAL